MCRTARRSSAVVKWITLLAALPGLLAIGSWPALAQNTCSSLLSITFPNDDNLNRTIGDQIAVRIQIIAGNSLNEGVPDTQSFSTVHFFPSCLAAEFAGCTIDEGETAGPPPPIEFLAFTGSNCSIVPSVDDSDPFDVKLNFSPPLTLGSAASCDVFFQVQFTEAGDLGSTPANIQQLAVTEGHCTNETSIGAGSSAIGLTCPPCPADGDPCTVDTCDPETFLCAHIPRDCDDHNVCTTDTCTGGDCVHSTPPNCDDGNVCTIDACTGPNEGDCRHRGNPCDDGNVCTIDTCTGPNPGDCSHSTPPNCDDGNVCTTDACTGPNEGDCSHSGNPCDDGNVCTIDTCTGPNPGDCAHSTPPNCDDGNVSTIDVCVGPNPGDCSHSTPECDDHNVCTIDTWTGPNPGDCAHSTPPNCDDGNVCTFDECTGPNPGDCSHMPACYADFCCDDGDCLTDDFCILGAGCQHEPNGHCEDGNVCTIDYCIGPGPNDCSHSTPPDCDDGNVSTIDACTGPNEGDCRHNDIRCDDGNVCTIDTYTGPGPEDCSHSTPPDCDDHNVCTIDTCTGPNPGDCAHSTPPDCDDQNVCTFDECTGPNPGDCVHSTPPTCDDGNICTVDACCLDFGGCCYSPQPNCDDGNVCTTDQCISPTECTHSTPPDCDDRNVCTIDTCTGPNPGDCVHSTPPNCDDANVCTIDECISPTECSHSTPPDCDDNNVCTLDSCTGPNSGDCSHEPSPLSQTCGTSDACVDRGCDPTDGCFENDHSSECGASETCVERGCDPATGCFERDLEPWPPECEEPQPGCRITAGGMTPDGGVDTAEFADSINARFGGQVGAACGCIGCSDSLSPIQGSWETSRKARRGSFHALDFNSLVCGCDGVLDGELCRPGDAELGSEALLAPANMACFSGIGNYNPTNGRRDIRVAFRVEVEDRVELEVGKVAPDDLYRIRIWIPGQDETAEGLADQICCTHAAPVGRDPDIDDGGGNLAHGNIEIHPPLATTEKATCPPPNGTCQQ